MLWLISLFAILVGVPSNLYATMPETLETGLLGHAKQQDANPFMQGATFDELFVRTQKVAPDVAEALNNTQGLSEEQKLTLLRSYLAEKSYEFYKNKILSEMKQRSQETNRQIVVHDNSYIDYGNEYKSFYYTLDRGSLDAPECRKDNMPACYYPDGFEDFWIMVNESTIQDKIERTVSTMNEISFFRDYPEQDKTIGCSISYINNVNLGDSNNQDTQTTQNAYIDVGCSTYTYQDYHTWRNNQVADVLAGGYEIVSERQLEPGSPFGDKVYSIRMSENPSQWKSNYVPKYEISSVMHDYMSDYSRKHNSNE